MKRRDFVKQLAFLPLLGRRMNLHEFCKLTGDLPSSPLMPASLAMALIMIGGIATTIISEQLVNVIICALVLVLCLITFITRLKDLAIELAIKQGYSKNN